MPHLLMSQTSAETRIELEFFRDCGGVPETLAYIPSRTDSARAYFTKIGTHYRTLGVKEVRYCDFDAEFSPEVRDRVWSSDAVYLSGGFTPYFLNVLREREALSLLLDFSHKKPLIGVSAGALIMGLDLMILSVDADEEEGQAALALPDPTGLGLYGFEFYPHYGRWATQAVRLLDRSRSKDARRILACDDVSGLIVSDSGVRVVGGADLFEAGSHRRLADQTILPPN